MGSGIPEGFHSDKRRTNQVLVLVMNFPGLIFLIFKKELTVSFLPDQIVYLHLARRDQGRGEVSRCPSKWGSCATLTHTRESLLAFPVLPIHRKMTHSFFYHEKNGHE